MGKGGCGWGWCVEGEWGGQDGVLWAVGCSDSVSLIPTSPYLQNIICWRVVCGSPIPQIKITNTDRVSCFVFLMIPEVSQQGPARLIQLKLCCARRVF